MSGPRRSGNTITRKLRECLHYVGQGMNDRQIAEMLGVGIYAVRARRYRIMEIIGCNTREGIIQYAKEH